MPKHTWGVRLRALGAVAACSLALVACGGDKDDETAPDAKDETASASPDDDLGGLLSGEPGEEDGLDPAEMLEALQGEALVLDHGSTPRVVQTFEVSEGQRLRSTMRMTMATTVNGEQSPSIPMVLVTSVEVQDVTEELITVRSIYDDLRLDEAGLPRALVEEIEPGLAALEGLAITTDQSRAGALLDTRFSLPDNAPPSAHQLVEQIASSVASYSVPFPLEPVGEGASWQVVDTLESGGITIAQTTTYVLEELDGQRYRISLDVDGTFEPTDAAAGVELVRGSAAAEGETSGVLGGLIPTEVTSEGTTTVVLRSGGRRVETVTDIDMTITTEAD